MSVKLGQLLVRSKIITEEQLTAALDSQSKDGGSIRRPVAGGETCQPDR